MTTQPDTLPPLTPDQIAAADDMAEYAVKHAAELAGLDAAARDGE